MQTLLLSREEVARKAWEIYDDSLRAALEVPGNIGKVVVIDVGSGDHVLDDEADPEPVRRLQQRHPGAPLFGIRIGYDVYATIGGVMGRSSSSRSSGAG